LLVLVAGAVIALAVPWAMMSAGATVSNPGAITVVFGCPVVSPPAGCIGQLALEGAVPITIDGISGTGTGTIDGAGVLNFPLAGLSFTPFDIVVAGAIPATVSIEPLADWTGNLDPATGVMTVHGPLMSHLNGGALLGTDCPIGPLDLNLTTGTSGAATGTPYSAATGFGIVVDNNFVIPATPDPNPTCSGASLINSAAPLPLPAGSATTTLSMLFSPAPQPGAVSTTTAAPTTTTTTAPTTTTTAAPTTTTTAAPTTTTTAAPTTTTTAAPTTTTTAAPTTTTTAAPTTTTTAAPTTTTTAAPTTTTTAAPTTTTTAAPTTTTTAAPTTTTTAGPTTTTTAGPTTTTIPAACNRPGNGFGDKNHVHCGPPGQNKKFGGKLIAATRSSGGMAFGFVVFTAAVTGLVLTTRRRRTIG
jgi:hypothetical protein